MASQIACMQCLIAVLGSDISEYEPIRCSDMSNAVSFWNITAMIFKSFTYPVNLTLGAKH